MRPLRVLVVDDNTDCADVLTMLVRLWGHDARAAYSAHAAVALAGAFQPDVALLDLRMPVVDGYQLGAWLKGLPGLAAPILIAVTGFGHARQAETSRAHGFAWHVAKGQEAEVLRPILGQLAERLA